MKQTRMICDSITTTGVWNGGKQDHVRSSDVAAETKSHLEVEATPFWNSCRRGVVICCFISLLINMSGQSAMTSAMVCMIERPSKTKGIINTTTNENVTFSAQQTDWKFAWGSKTENLILSSFFILYYVGQLPSGIMAQRFSNRKLLIIGHGFSGLLQILTVPSTQLGLPWIVVTRLIGGMTSSLILSNSMAIVTNWTPRQETNTVFGSAGLSMEAGNMVAFGLSTFACNIDILGGWPFVFFCHGALQLIVMLLFLLYIHENPITHNSITPDERFYIMASTTQKKTWAKTPVRAIVTSIPVIALIVCKLASTFGYFVFVIVSPQFARDILKLRSVYISIVYSLPYLVIIPVIFTMAKLSDHVLLKGIVSTTFVRKLFDFGNKIIYAALIIVLGYLPEHSWPIAFIVNTAILCTVGCGFLNYLANPADLGPAHTGFIVAFVQMAVYWASFVSPIFVGALTEEATRESWQRVFFIAAGVHVAAFVVFAVFGSGELQPWALLEEPLEPVTDKNNKRSSTEESSTTIESNGGICSPNGSHACTYKSKSNENTPLFLRN